MTFTTMDEITSAIKSCITSEMKEGGLLYDVIDFIPSYRLEDSMELPAVWLFEHPTTLKGKIGFGDVMTLTTPFEFVCVCFDDDIEKAEIMGKNLAGRVAISIYKNKYQMVENKRLFNDIRFQTLYPVGEVQIQGKLNRIPATSVILEVDYSVYWIDGDTSDENIKKILFGDVDTRVVAEDLYIHDKSQKNHGG